MAANATVTAPYIDASTLTTHRFALAPGKAKGCRKISTTAVVITTLARRINHTDGALPSSGTTRVPRSQNITPNPAAENNAQPTPNIRVPGRVFSPRLASSGIRSPRATTTTPTMINAIPANLSRVNLSPVSAASNVVRAG